MGAQAEAAVLSGEPLGRLPAAPVDGPGLDGGPLPRAYRLRRIALSHSHVGFAPTGFDPATETFHHVLRAGSVGPVPVAVQQVRDRLVLRLPGTPRLTGQDEADLTAQVRRVLAADDDLSGLVDAAAACADRLPVVAREAAAGGGRLLRSPTVWEDLVGVLLSTGWSWAAARGAVGRLVEAYGDVGPGGARAFPTPLAVASADPGRFSADVRAGRRAVALLALARDVASGEVDPEAWRTGAEAWRAGALDDGEVRRAVTALRGFGPWSADVLLGLLGRPRGLALDRWARQKLGRLLDRPAPSPVDVAERYAPLGPWGGTGAWLELTADWHVERAPRVAA